MPTTNGTAEWSATGLKKILLKPAVAGQAAHTSVMRDAEGRPVMDGGKPRTVTTLKPAPWPAILEPDVERRMR